MRTIYIDGKYLQVKAGFLEAFTPGVFKAKGVFETMLGMDGVVMDAKEHVTRMKAGLRKLKIKPPHINTHILTEVLRRNQLSVARVRLIAWKEGRDIHLMAAALPYKISTKTYRVCVVKTAHPAHADMANVKSLDYGIFFHAFIRAQQQGFDEALLVNRKGHIFEASRANIFWTRGNRLYTTPLSSGCLDGVTRRKTIRQAKRLKIPFQEKVLTVSMLKKADHAFLTNSLIGIKPIDISGIS